MGEPTPPTCDACGKPLVRCASCGEVGGGPCECNEEEREIEKDDVLQSVELYRQTHSSPAEGESRHVHRACEDEPWPEVDSVLARRRHCRRTAYCDL